MLPAGTVRSSHRPRSTPRLAAAEITGGSAGPRVVSSAHPASADAAAEMANNSDGVEVAVRIILSPDRKVVCGCSHLLIRNTLSKPATRCSSVQPAREEPLAPTLWAAQSWAEAKHLMAAPL